MQRDDRDHIIELNRFTFDARSCELFDAAGARVALRAQTLGSCNAWCAAPTAS
jgi:hypothetical protein